MKHAKAIIVGDGQRYAETEDGQLYLVQSKGPVGKVYPGDKVVVTLPADSDGYATIVRRETS
jgi:hypothetical protein